jgi:hypothetical protein
MGVWCVGIRIPYVKPGGGSVYVHTDTLPFLLNQMLFFIINVANIQFN